MSKFHKALILFSTILTLFFIVVLIYAMSKEDVTQNIVKEIPKDTPKKERSFGTVNTIVDGFDVERVNLWSTTDDDRKTIGKCINGEFVEILDTFNLDSTEEGAKYYIKIKTSNGAEGWFLNGFVNLDEHPALGKYCFGENLYAHALAEDFVKEQLKSPSSAIFPSTSEKIARTINIGGCSYKIFSWVESQNPFGVMIRNKFECILTFNGENYTCSKLKFY